MFQNGRRLSNWNETIICCRTSRSQSLVFSQFVGLAVHMQWFLRDQLAARRNIRNT